MSCDLWLVLIETTGNQRHIFETNKLAENVGASQQLYLLGNDEVLAAIRDVFGDAAAQLKKADDVHDSSINRPIEYDGVKFEIWYLSSGKAMVFVRDREDGRKIVQAVTRAAFEKYPGVVVRGAIEAIEQFTVDCLDSVDRLGTAVTQVHERLAQKRGTLPPPEQRFQRLPLVAECRNSGLPAAGALRDGSQPVDVSATCAAKRGGFSADRRLKWRKSILERMSEVIPGELLTARHLDDLESWLGTVRYLAVVHADGNGVGRIFQHFSTYAQPRNAREYIDKLRAFSKGIDCCTKEAFKCAVNIVCGEGSQFVTIDHGRRQLKAPVLPLIVGGDDLTILSTAEFAMALVPVFLRFLEEKFAACRDVSVIAKAATGVPRLGMTAGIAIVKPHYPFSSAYGIAEGLLASAKRTVKKQVSKRVNDQVVPLPVTAFDFHVHHSASGGDLEDVRAELEFDVSCGSSVKLCRLWGGPYVVTTDLTSSSGADWADRHRMATLSRQTAALQKLSSDDGDRRELPNSQMHALRAALFDGPDVAEAQLNLIRHRYPSMDRVLGDGLSIFYSDEDSTQVTSLLDAMSLAHLKVRLELQNELVGGLT